MKKIIKMLRLDQKTTWVGIVGFAGTIFGMAIRPELAGQIATLGTTISCILIGYNEPSKK
jgi:hypothetical protein